MALPIVQEYKAPTDLPTVTYSKKINQELERNGVERPKGYTVSWHANPEVEKHHFGQQHPMKPWRLTLTKSIVIAYGMHTAMDNYLSRAATKEELLDFHKSDYIEFLSRVTPVNMLDGPLSAGIQSFNMGDDCPVFDGLFNYCSLYSGGSLDASRKLINRQSDIAINWSGGLHHAKKGEASGFCYINDIVLGILQLLRHHPRVLYIDIDVHHGDGVEQAFRSTDRVLTVSFHRYDRENFFPGTGALTDTGPEHPQNPGAHYSLNVPLNEGIDDESYVWLFKSIIGPCISTYRPTAICLQCGADSLGNDRLGCFNLNIRGHGACVSFVKSFNIPLLVVGGGGYTPRNVARLWAHETSICIGADNQISPTIPSHTPFLEHLEGNELFPSLQNTVKYENKNPRPYLENIVAHCREQLRYIQGAPSVQMQHIPPDLGAWREEIEKELEEEEREREEKKEDGLNGDIGGRNRRREAEKGVGGRNEMAV
ncbi:MAG: hypothetical protein Q9227_000240 [Pyrenula ochraceoflavens]